MAEAEMSQGRGTSTRRTIHIVGGGPAGLAAAFKILQFDQTPGKPDHHIIVYQMGWRLGGKCASSRNPDAGMRVEEHGLHLLGGSYHNTLEMLKIIYDDLLRSGTIDKTFEDAFFAAERVKIGHRTSTGWHLIDAKFPRNELKIGSKPETLLPSTILTALEGWARAMLSEASFVTSRPIVKLAEVVGSIERALGFARRPSWMPPTPGEVLKDIAGQFHSNSNGLSTEMELPTDIDLRLVAELMLAAVRGIATDGVPAKGFDSINHEEFSAWLHKHGASEDAIESAYQRAGYDYVFGYQNGDADQPSLAAGVALKGLLRTYLCFHGSVLLHSAGSLGETYILPLYLYLKQRGVEFKFFHMLDGIHMNASKTEVSKLRFVIQPTHGTQTPIEDYKDAFLGKIWSDRPSGFAHGAHMAEDQYENPFFQFDPKPEVKDISLKNHDEVIVAIPLAAIEQLQIKAGSADWERASDALSSIPSWRDAFSGHASVATGAVQFWFDLPKSVHQSIKEVTATALPSPFSTWAEQSHQLPAIDIEASPEPQRTSLSYFCGQLDDKDYPMEALTTPEAMEAARAKLTKSFLSWWYENGALLYPRTAHQMTHFTPDNLYVRLNVRPSDRYVLSLPGSIRKRIGAGETGVGNMRVAGDWTRNGGNAGAVEYAVMSGFQAARICARQNAYIFGEAELE